MQHDGMSTLIKENFPEHMLTKMFVVWSRTSKFSLFTEMLYTLICLQI